MLECYIRECESLDDPIKKPELMSDLSDIRKKAIMKYKMEADRKRSLMAGLMMRDVLRQHKLDAGDVIIGDNGRPSIEGIDFNISHSGKYVLMVISDGRVGCDIEHIRERNYSVAKRCFTVGEINRMEESGAKDLTFYRIWTARESYSKLTGEGILLDFKEYEIINAKHEYKHEGILVQQNAKYLGSCQVKRGDILQGCHINQWLYDDDYVVSICSM